MTKLDKTILFTLVIGILIAVGYIIWRNPEPSSQIDIKINTPRFILDFEKVSSAKQLPDLRRQYQNCNFTLEGNVVSLIDDNIMFLRVRKTSVMVVSDRPIDGISEGDTVVLDCRVKTFTVLGPILKLNRFIRKVL